MGFKSRENARRMIKYVDFIIKERPNRIRTYAPNCHPERQRRISRECEIANELRDSSLRYAPLRMTLRNSCYPYMAGDGPHDGT